MRKKIYLLVVFLVILTASAFAQKGRFQVRFTVKSIDCAAARAVIVVQVKSSRPDSTFLMGDANYRFNYDPRLIRNPQIVSQENFSNVAPASDNNYLAQNLTGSTAGPTRGLVSLNTVYGGTGSGGRQVATDWMNVACIGFDIVNTQAVANNCFGLVWNTDTDFPITGMNEVILTGNSTYRSQPVTPARFFGNLQVCVPQYCSINANDDYVTTPFKTPVSGNLLTNDLTAPLVLTTTPVAQPRNGAIVLNADGTFTYTPNGTFSGKDSVQYRACLKNTPTVCDNAWLYITVGAPAKIDLSLAQTVSSSRPAEGDVLSYSLVVTNSSSLEATGVEVTDILPAGVTYQSSSGQGTYDPNTSRWTVGNVAANRTATMIIRVRVNAGGTWFNKAEISKANEPDADSTPNNDVLSEDDISIACFAVPILICPGDEYQLSLPTGYNGIQWFRDGTAIAGANGSTLSVTSAGTYTFTATNSTCPAQGCCPAIFLEGACCKPTICVPVTIKRTKSARIQ